MKKIAILRHSALGDIITILNFTKAMQQDGKHVTLFSCKKIYNTLKNFIFKNKLAAFDYIENYNKDNFDITIKPKAYTLPENFLTFKPTQHILESYANQLNVQFSFNLFNLKLPKIPSIIANSQLNKYITIQNDTEWSIYKKWWGWQDLVDMIKKNKPKIQIYQIGGIQDEKIKNIDGTLCGESFEKNLSAQAHAWVHLGLDSVFNHTSNINWIGKGKTKSIILFGSTDHSTIGYPHNTNISLNLSCQPCFKVVNKEIVKSKLKLNLCNNPPEQNFENPQHSCMKNITPLMIYKKIFANDALTFI